MIQIKCDKCENEFAITRDKCPVCGDPVKTTCKFFCGHCESKIDVKKQICPNCGEKLDEIIIEKSDGERIKTKFETEDSEYIEINEIEEKNEKKSLENDDSEARKKIAKTLANDMMILFVIEIIYVLVSLFLSQFNFFAVVFAIVLFIGYKKASNEEKTAGTIGMVVGILMMLTILMMDIPNFLLGLFVLIHSNKYNKLFK